VARLEPSALRLIYGERGSCDRSLATASRNFASIAGVSTRQPHALAWARCHRKRCAAVGRGGMRCFWCHDAL